MTNLHAILGRGAASLESSLKLLEPHVVSSVEGRTTIRTEGRRALELPWVAIDPVARGTRRQVTVRQGRLSSNEPLFEVSWKVPHEAWTAAGPSLIGVIRLRLFVGHDVSGITFRCATRSVKAQLDSILEHLKPAAASGGLMLLEQREPLVFVELLSGIEISLEWEDYEHFEHEDASLDFDWLVDRFATVGDLGLKEHLSD